MSIERFHQKMESGSEESALFKALRKLRKIDSAAVALETTLLWPNW